MSPVERVPWRSFEAFEAYVRSLSEEKARGDAFEGLVYAYLRLTRELALTDVWSLAEAPDEVIRRLGLTNHDIGSISSANDETVRCGPSR